MMSSSITTLLCSVYSKNSSAKSPPLDRAASSTFFMISFVTPNRLANSSSPGLRIMPAKSWS